MLKLYIDSYSIVTMRLKANKSGETQEAILTLTRLQAENEEWRLEGKPRP